MSCPSISSGVEVSRDASGLCYYTPQCKSPFTFDTNQSKCVYKLSSPGESCPSSSNMILPQLCEYTPSCDSSYSLHYSLCKYSLPPLSSPSSPSSPSLPLPK